MPRTILNSATRVDDDVKFFGLGSRYQLYRSQGRLLLT
ncbi:hypothetical protein HG15A2_01230 [Adhaeretor mobilis]|uniref:Uncharacterized protein n=1 Tax=Adhaeretor mobilis TaxID=1930276 RepID=A0A517MPR6_9BACT|nr:hypothetical protein HG15A2_01230 [Adhaeretor mobilis]